jgi:hypothetical protein
VALDLLPHDGNLSDEFRTDLFLNALHSRVGTMPPDNLLHHFIQNLSEASESAQNLDGCGLTDTLTAALR